MFERFTDRARRVVVLAQEEARLLDHNYIGTEHILLGLIHEGEGVAYLALTALGISLDAVRAQVEADRSATAARRRAGHIPFTPRAKKVLELSLREALQLGHNYIGTEHILLGLIREGEGVAAQVLVGSAPASTVVRQQVVQLLANAGAAQAEQVAGGPARIGQQAVTAMVAGGPGSYRRGAGRAGPGGAAGPRGLPRPRLPGGADLAGGLVGLAGPALRPAARRAAGHPADAGDGPRLAARPTAPPGPTSWPGPPRAAAACSASTS